MSKVKERSASRPRESSSEEDGSNRPAVSKKPKTCEDRPSRWESNKMFEEMEKMKTLISTNFSDLKEDVDELKQYCRDLKQSVQDLQDKVQKVNARVDNQYKKIESVTEKINKQEKSIEELSKKVDGQSKAIESMRSDARKVKDRVYDAEEHVKASQVVLEKTKVENKDVQRSVIDQRARSMRDNLLFFGIEEKPDENVEEVLLDFIKTKMKINSTVVLVRVHRLKKPTNASTTYIGRNANKPRPIIARFLDNRQRELVRKARFELKSPFGVNEDLPIEVRSAQAALRGQLDEIKKTKIQDGSRFKRATIIYPATLICEGEIVTKLDVADYIRPKA